MLTLVRQCAIMFSAMKKVFKATITQKQLKELLAGQTVEIVNRSDMILFRINLEPEERHEATTGAKK